MHIGWITLGFVVITLTLCFLYIKKLEKKNVKHGFFCILFLTVGIAYGSLCAICLIADENKDKPTALDSYRGKTTLVVNGDYIDGVFHPKDSTVIFKPIEIEQEAITEQTITE